MNSNTQRCKYCKSAAVHYELHDSFFCVLCNIWTEGKCTYEQCTYCNNRPDKPFTDVIYLTLMKAYENIGMSGLLVLVDEYLEEEYSGM